MSARLPLRIAGLALSLLLTGCESVVLSPSGDVARQQGNLIVVATVLMCLIVLPVMALTGWFAWHYRASNQKATYTPEWNHSTQLELVIWSAPLLIVIALGAVTWISTHTLDPFRKLDRIAPGKPVTAEMHPLRVQVVAMDWKWLFIYPDHGIASINEMAAPVNVPIEFEITASTVMNAFYVPALAGMIYAMPAMETKLHAVINEPGEYDGFSANYSGAGFSHMRFKFHGLDGAKFDTWVAQVRAAPLMLGRAEYLALEKPSEREPVRHYGQAMAGLFDAVVNLCVEPTQMCMKDMMAIDARGGLGLANVYNVARLRFDSDRRRGASLLPADEYVTALCAVEREEMLLGSAAPHYGPRRPAP